MTERHAKKRRKFAHEILGLIALSALSALIIFLILTQAAATATEVYCFNKDVPMTEFDWIAVDRWIFGTGAVIAITGAIDIVADRENAYCIRNGHPMMSSITGTGCQLSAMTAAFVTANPDHPLEATAAAVSAMGYAGEVAYRRLTEADGNATYRNYIIDAIYNLTPEMLEKGANYEVR